MGCRGVQALRPDRRTLTIHWEPQATDDARGIWLYIASDSLPRADAWLERLLDKVALLESNPALGPPRDELLPDLRSITLGQYLIFYRPMAGGIDVVRILHGSRDVTREMRRD